MGDVAGDGDLWRAFTVERGLSGFNPFGPVALAVDDDGEGRSTFRLLDHWGRVLELALVDSRSVPSAWAEARGLMLVDTDDDDPSALERLEVDGAGEITAYWRCARVATLEAGWVDADIRLVARHGNGRELVEQFVSSDTFECSAAEVAQVAAEFCATHGFVPGRELPQRGAARVWEARRAAFWAA